jgi:hypothetical protein
MKFLYVVNASPLLQDAEVNDVITPLQTQIDRDFIPAWRGRLREPGIKVVPAGMHDIPSLVPDCWPIFLNRHSNDADSLGWHDDDPTQNIRTYSRVFVGDCMQLGLNWHTTLSHEALELILDPDIRRIFKMANGRLAAYEACDAVEADELAYSIGGFAASDFVLPNYFSRSGLPPFDFGRHLKGRCPDLTSGGYMSVTNSKGVWTQVSKDRRGLKSRRAMMPGFRRQHRATGQFEEVE